MKYIAQGISAISHPLLFLTIAFLVLTNLFPYYPISSNDPFFSTILWFVFLCTFLLPVLVIFLMMRWGMVSDITISKRDERILPMFFVAILYIGLNQYIFTRVSMEPLFMNITYLMSAILIVTVAITWFWKISAHAIGIGSASGFLFLLYETSPTSSLFIALVVSILIAGIIMSARLYLNAHTPKQVYWGYFTGVVSGVLGGVLVL